MYINYKYEYNFFPYILIYIPKLPLFVPDLGSMILFYKGTDSTYFRLSRSIVSVTSPQKAAIANV